MYYLDNAATTIPYPQVLEEIQQLYVACFGNPSSVHTAGQEAERIVHRSRKQLAEIFGVPQAGIIFCGSGSESDNLAIKGYVQTQSQKKLRIITSPLEHAAVLQTCDWLTRHHPVEIDLVAIDKHTGQIDLNHLEKLVGKDTRLVSIQHVNSETGVVQDLKQIVHVVKSIDPAIIVHSDGVQAFSRIPVNLVELGVDLYSISAHKFHGLKGVGALIMTKAIPLTPLIHGGGQEHGLRSGTENVVGIAAMALAAEIAVSQQTRNLETVTRFAELFKQALVSRFPSCRIAKPPMSIPHILSVSFPGILGEVLLHHLAEKGIYVSTGSACNASSKKLSTVLQALGYSKERIRETLRISIAAKEIPEDVEEFFARFNQAVESVAKAVIG